MVARQRESVGDRFVRTSFAVMLVIAAVLASYPFVRTLSVSFSQGSAAERGEVTLLPVRPTAAAWTDVVLRSGSLWRSAGITVYVTSLGTFLSVSFTSLFAYPLAHRRFRYRRALMFLVVFTMIFRYPLIPYFLVIRSYGLLNTLWSQILTHLVVAFNLVVLRTFFMQLPHELDESATMEGANHIQILLRITLPLSRAALATIGLFYAVLYWNLYLHPMLFLQNSDLYPLQLRLRMMLQTVDEAASNMQARTDFSPTTVRSATIIFATVPILLVYPFLQKHFAKGAMIGSLKG